MNLATWNIQGLRTKQREVFTELEKMNIDIGVLTETKKKGAGNERVGKYIHFYSGVNKNERAKRGVSMVVHQKLQQCIKSWKEINERIISLELKKNGHEIVIVGVYAPTDDADCDIKDTFYRKLTEVLNDIPPRKELILMGDLNARVGRTENNEIIGRYGEDIRNESGQRLIDLCETQDLKILNGYFPHKEIHKFTWTQTNRNLKSIIDYVIQRQNSKLKAQDVRVYRGAECGSDHFMVKAIVLLQYKKTNNENQSKLSVHKAITKPDQYNLESLRHESTQFLYKMRVANRLKDLNESTAEDMYQELRKHLQNSAKEALGIQHQKDYKNEQPEWWTNKIANKVKEKKLLYQKWLSTQDSEDRKEYARINREVKKEVIKLKQELWDRRCEQVDRCMGGTKVNEAWKFIKCLRKNKNERINVPIINISKWKEHYEKLLTENRVEYKHITNNKRDKVDGGMVEPISSIEVRKAAQEMKNKKAAGPGNISSELIKYGPSILWEKLANLFNKFMLEGQEIPQDLRLSHISSIFKKGDKKNCNNYRGISVTSSLGRLYGRLLKQRIEKEMVNIEEQSGFRAGRSCVDNTFSLRQLIEKRLERNLETHIIFIDLEKAYDSVPLCKLFEVLNNSGINKTYVKCVQDIYRKTVGMIKMGNESSPQFEITKGLKQGCCLSPTLFKIYLQGVLENWQKKCKCMGIELNGNWLYTLLFADDQVVVANDEDDLAYMMRKLIEEYSKWGLNINTMKTLYLPIGKDGVDLQISSSLVIKKCSQYTYLGSIINQEGSCEDDIRHRINLGKASIQVLNALLWSSKFRWQTKMKIYKTIIEPITTYGAESWSITERNRKKIEAVEMDFLRRSLKVSRLEHIKNEEIRERSAKKETILHHIEQKQLLWYGHINRMEEERIPKNVFLYQPDRRRKRGRPRTTWIQGIESAMTRRHLKQEDTQDRKLWRLKCGMRQKP